MICRHLFAGHVVGCRPMKRMAKMHRMIIRFTLYYIFFSLKKVSVYCSYFRDSARSRFFGMLCGPGLSLTYDHCG